MDMQCLQETWLETAIIMAAGMVLYHRMAERFIQEYRESLKLIGKVDDKFYDMMPAMEDMFRDRTDRDFGLLFRAMRHSHDKWVKWSCRSVKYDRNIKIAGTFVVVCFLLFLPVDICAGMEDVVRTLQVSLAAAMATSGLMLAIGLATAVMGGRTAKLLEHCQETILGAAAE